MGKCLIISGGEYNELPETVEYDFCIACDKGYEYAKKMEIFPDIVIGDFDSIDESGRDEISRLDDVITYPVEKDDTDTMLAIKKALALGYEHIILICALGGRLDHTIANIQSMHYVASHGAKCELYGSNEYSVTLCNGRTVIPYEKGKSISIFSLSDKSEGLSISGAKYNVSDVVLTSDFPLGLGNSWENDEIEVSVRKGILLIVESILE